MCERSMTWTLERLFLWYAQWTPAEWHTAIQESEWSVDDWTLWWNNELLKAQEESDRLWRQEVENPNIFIDLTVEVHWDARGRRLLCGKGGLPSIGE